MIKPSAMYLEFVSRIQAIRLNEQLTVTGNKQNLLDTVSSLSSQLESRYIKSKLTTSEITILKREINHTTYWS